jgi:hypothetical protein
MRTSIKKGLVLAYSIMAIAELLALAALIGWLTNTAIVDPDALLPALTVLRWTALVIGILIGTAVGLMVPPFFFFLIPYLVLLSLLAAALFHAVRGLWYVFTAPYREIPRLLR